MKFLRMKNELYFFDYDKITIHDSLPHGIYELKESSDRASGESVKIVDETVLSTNVNKLYSPLNLYFNRIYTEFKNSNCKYLGCLFSGIKGSGKTLLSSQLCHELYKDGYSILIVNKQIDSYDLLNIIKQINNNLVIFIDEFEKVITDVNDRDHNISNQEKLLSYLGNDNNKYKTLFLLTANDIYSINTNLLNRPGRIKYHFVFKNITSETIKEYCDDYLQNKDRLTDILTISKLSMVFTFDILKTIVNQINMYNDSIEDIFTYLNINKDPNDRYNLQYFKLSIFDANNKLIGTRQFESNYKNFLYNQFDLDLKRVTYQNNKESIFEKIGYYLDIKKCKIEKETEKYKKYSFSINNIKFIIKIELMESKLEKFSFCDMFNEQTKCSSYDTVGCQDDGDVDIDD